MSFMDSLLVQLATIMVTIIITLTLYYLNRLLPTKKTKTSDPAFHQDRIVRLSNLLRFIHIIGQTRNIIFHIEYFYVNFYLFTCIFLNYPTHFCRMWYFLLSDNKTFYHFCVTIQLYSFPPSTYFLRLLNFDPCVVLSWNLPTSYLLDNIQPANFIFLIYHKKVTNIQRLDYFTYTTFIINLEKNCTLVVLIHYVLVNIVPLTFNK